MQDWCHIETLPDGDKVLFYFEPDGDDAIIHQIVDGDGAQADIKVSGPAESMRALWVGIDFPTVAPKAYATALELFSAFRDEEDE